MLQGEKGCNSVLEIVESDPQLTIMRSLIEVSFFDADRPRNVLTVQIL